MGNNFHFDQNDLFLAKMVILGVLFEAVYLLTIGRLSGTTSVLKNPGTIGKNDWFNVFVGMSDRFLTKNGGT